MIYILRAFVI